MKSAKFSWSRSAVGLVAAFVSLLSAGPALAQQVHRNGFEQKIGWVRSGADAAFDEITHNISEDVAHDGQRSEYLQLRVKSGTFIHYQYAIGQAPVSDEFSARIWVKANRPGIRLQARLILPNERDPKFLESRLSTMLPGDDYRNVGRWQQLEIPRPRLLLEKAKAKMQSRDQVGRPVDFTDAYVDALVLNVYAGPGELEIWIDDLEVGPVSGPVPAAPSGLKTTPPGAVRPLRNQFVRYDGSWLMVGDRKWLIRGVRLADVPQTAQGLEQASRTLRALRDGGFNTIYMDCAMPAKLVREAVDLGFWIVPQLHLQGNDPRLVSTDSNDLARDVNRFADNDALIFWNLGNRLTGQQADSVARAMQTIQSMDNGRFFGGDISDGTQQYSRHQNFVLGNHRFPLFSSMELLAYRDWLDQHRRLAQPGAYLWTSIQNHMSDEQTQLIYDRSSRDAFTEPVGPMPEQLRLLTYTALACGYRGINLWSDRWLADSHQGRDRLLCSAMLNQELDMLEPILMSLDEPPQWIETSVPEVKAAVLRTAKGALVLPIWLGKGSQYVAGQAAVAKLTIIVPHIPQTMQAWDVHPADIHNLRCDRVVGGTKVTIPEFCLTAAILFTADTKLVQRLQEQSQARRQLAAQWSHDLADYELKKARRVHDQLAALGHTLTDANHLLVEAHKSMLSARQLWDNHNFRESYHESQRAMRPIRILMRMHWDRAVKELDAPVASPYAVTYFSLPRHWQFMEQKDRLVATPNVLPGGEFEVIKERPQESWHSEETVGDDVEVAATRVSDVVRYDQKGQKVLEPPHGGRQCALLQIKAPAKRPAPATIEKSRIAIISPTVKFQPGTLVQVTAWIHLTENVQGSADGAMFYDSVGGEDLAVRLVETTKKWKKYTLYRRIPASGSIYVTLALTGLGNAYFDDVTIEPLVPAAGSNPNIINPVRFNGGTAP